jgi:formamidase
MLRSFSKLLSYPFGQLILRPPRTLVKVDLSKPPQKQPVPLHNRWHPDIPAVATVTQGEVFRMECLDWTGGQIKYDDSPKDIDSCDLNQVHYLSGPIHVEGAEPGDLLEIDLLDIGALRESLWGFTGIFARENGGGFLTDHFPKAHKAVWDFEGRYATSRQIPHVRLAGLPHPGIIGTAPSH